MKQSYDEIKVQTATEPSTDCRRSEGGLYVCCKMLTCSGNNMKHKTFQSIFVCTGSLTVCHHGILSDSTI